jgi:hypothetical protein
VYICVFVDGILVIGNDTIKIKEFTDTLKTTLIKLTVFGEIKKYIGIDITRDRQKRSITLTQRPHIKNYVDKGVPHNANPKIVPIPFTINNHVKNDDKKQNPTINSEVGRLRYIVNHTRPDIFASAGILRPVNNPHDNHLKALRHLSRYLNGEPDVGLTLGGEKLFAFSDASFLRYLDSKPRLAYAFYLGLNSGTICARLLKSNTVSSTADAEIKALGLTTVQTVWLKGFL